MASTAQCVTPIKGTAYRLVKLDACGNPVTGASGMQIVGKGFVQCALVPQYDNGVEFFQRTADGNVCVNQLDDPVFKRFEMTIDFCEVNETGVSWMTSMRELTTGSPTTGVGFAMGEGLQSNRWSLEIWQAIAGANACNSSGQQQYIYNAWPNVGAGKMGNYTIANAMSTFQVVGESRAVANSPTVGWYAKNGSASWLPSGFASQANDHWYWDITTTPPPAPACSPTASL